MRKKILLVAAPSLVLVAVVGVLLWRGLPGAGSSEATLRAVFDSPLAGARAAEVRLVVADELFNHINGAAPLYLERGFRRLVVADLREEGGLELSCDVYDMGSAQNARAIFDTESPPGSPPSRDWPDARESSLSLVFIEGRHYVKLTAFDRKAQPLLGAVGRALRERIR